MYYTSKIKQPKTYINNVKKPKTYINNVKKPKTYINNVKKPKTYISNVKKPKTYINNVKIPLPISKFNNINILIRNTYSPTTFRKCLQSILMQTYTNYRIIMCYDDDRCMEYLSEYINHKNIELFKVKRESKGPYFYNLYCNHLLDKVRDGWIIFLNDNNMFAQSDSLKKINNKIKTENDIIFWKVKLGDNIIFPNIYDIQLGEIDITGLCFHSKYKIDCRWVAENDSEFNYISKLLNKHRFIRRTHADILTQTVLLKADDENFSELFHKYTLEIATPFQPIIYSILNGELPFDNPLVAHLHCYNIDIFFDIYGEILETINSLFKLVVTFSIGTKIPKQLTCLLVENRGMDIGGKFCVIDYLKDKNYTHILYLHSKSNPERRALYFSPLIDNLEEIIDERANYDGVFPDLKWDIDGEIIRNKWGEENREVNHLYRNQLLDYLKIEDRMDEFIEGNVYFLTREVSERVFGDLALYNILNRPTDFDYNYIMKKYGVRGELTELFQHFGKVDIASGENYGNIEQSFERIMLNCCGMSRIVEKIIKPTILIDCQCLQHEIRGIGRYGENLVNTLIEYNKAYNIVLLINNFLGKELLGRIKLANNASFIECPFNNIENPDHHERNVFYNDTEYIHEQTLASLIDTINPFIYINLSEFDRRIVALNRSLLKNQNIKTYCILHDLIPLRRKLYDTLPKWKINYQKQLINCQTYNKLLSNSKFTLNDSTDIFNNIEHLGTGVYDINLQIDNITSTEILSKFKIDKPYIFTQSSFDRHKGFDILYNIYNNLPESFKETYLLVIGSEIPENYFDSIPNNIIITGYLSSKELSVLHNNAWLFVFPSRSEGFGIPPVEAWWHNTPVIVARNTSLIEVMNNTEYTFTDESLPDLLIKLDKDKLFYHNCLEHGLTQRYTFKWDTIIDRLNIIIKLKITILILVKNNAEWLEYLHAYFNKIEPLYKDLLEFEYFIYENNSTDTTKIVIQKFIKNRKGLFICENIPTEFNMEAGIDFKRGLHMNSIRNRAKDKFGKINSDYILLLDSDTILEKITIFKMIYYIHQDATIAAITPYVECKNHHYINHYYDSLAIITDNNLDYIKNQNTCMFTHCQRCSAHRKLKKINIPNRDLFKMTSNEISVKSAFGSCCLVKSELYNKCEYNKTLFIQSNHVCEHIAFNKQLLKYGRIIIKPDIRIVNKSFK